MTFVDPSGFAYFRTAEDNAGCDEDDCLCLFAGDDRFDTAAAQADAIVTRDVRDLSRGELKFPSLRVLKPEQCLEVFPCRR